MFQTQPIIYTSFLCFVVNGTITRPLIFSDIPNCASVNSRHVYCLSNFLLKEFNQFSAFCLSLKWMKYWIFRPKKIVPNCRWSCFVTIPLAGNSSIHVVRYLLISGFITLKYFDFLPIYLTSDGREGNKGILYCSVRSCRSK